MERKRREFAVLRLLGVHGLTLCAFPLTSGVCMTLAGLLLGLVCFHAIGLFINQISAAFTLPGETLCRLSMAQQGAGVLLGLCTALAAGICAAYRLHRIRPAESLRDE